MRHLTPITVAATLAAAPALALSVTPIADAPTLAAATLAPSSGLTITAGSAAIAGAEDQQGTYSSFSLGSPVDGTRTLPDGAVLTTGTADFSVTENTTNNFNTAPGGAPFAPLVTLAEENGLSTEQNDTNTLTFGFTADDAGAVGITAQFVFATDEFPTQSVTDILGIFVNGTNVARFPNGDLVSNQGGDPNNFFGSEFPLEWNGLTDAFTIEAPIVAGENSITVAIADTSDTIFDSAVFFGGLQAIGDFTGGGDGGGGGIIDMPVIPLPAGVFLLPMGLAALGGLRRRARRG
jgi:hypothetical protein